MPAPLLETKLYLPKPRRDLVPRPRLSERLAQGAASKLMLVSAPAGFGKTTVLSQWLAAEPAPPADERSCAWLSLDRGDNDRASFWAHVIAALRTVAPEVGAGTLSLLQESFSPSAIETVLTPLLNDLASIAGDVVLVLDDYHVIDALDVQDGMAFLLEHLPPQIHLVIAGRADPALPLARLRGRGELVEIRAADLRFVPDEAAAYLNGVMGLQLSTTDVTALEGRTEGWIVALQLAGLSMQGRDDIAGFIAGFAGDDHYIVDYLVEEVLQRQPEPVRSFLLQTSILSRLNGSLCDAVTGVEGGKAMLEALDRANLFLVALDDRRQWYRYHHLFADVLRTRLLDEQPHRVRELHTGASDWYERNGERLAAIRHAMAGDDFERAADLVELALPELRQSRQDATLSLWLEMLPDALIRVRPVLSVGYAGALMVRGEVVGVEARLRDAEQWLETTSGQEIPDAQRPTAGMVVVDEKEFRGLPGAIAMYRAGLALLSGDVPGTMTQARLALDLVDEGNHLGRASPAALLGLAHWTSGDLATANRWYTDAMANLERAGHLSDVIGCSIALADIRLVQGRLGEAMSIYERGLQRATQQAGPALRGAADMHVGMSQVLRERNDLDASMEHLLEGRELGEYAGLPQNRYRWRVAMAQVREAHADLAGALELLNEAEQLYDGDFSPNVRPVPAVRARVQVALGRWGEALGWARERGLSSTDDLSYLHELEHVTLARVLLAQHRAERAEGSIEEVTRLLARLLQAAEEGNRSGSVIEILVLQSLAHQTRGDIPAALASLQHALALAEPEGYVRVFVDEGPPMISLLRAVARGTHGEQKGVTAGHVRRLLAAVNKNAEIATVQQGLPEPLSERELDVLRLLGTDLDGPDIARALFVSLNTMRTHTKNVYAKLGVSNRRAAVRRAQELDLLAGNRD